MKKWNKSILFSLLGLTLPFALISASCTKTSSPSITEEQVNYLNKNSLSLNFRYVGNYNNLNEQINKLVDDSISSSNDIFDFRELASWTQKLFAGDRAKYIIATSQISQSGTGWIFDYSLDSINNLVNYYIATNAHVLNSELKYLLTNTLDNSELENDKRFSIHIGFPVNNKNISLYKSFISQPQQEQEVSIYDPQYWLPTQNYLDSTQNNLLEQILPIGQLDNENKISVGSEKEICFYYEITQFNNNNKNYLFVTKDANNKYKVIPSWKLNLINDWLNFSPLADDFQIIKLQYKLGLENNSNLVDTNLNLLEIKKSIVSMLDYKNNNTSIDESSSYISRLNYLIKAIRNQQIFDKKWFLFNDLNNLSNDNVISFGGFPVTSVNENLFASYKYAYGTKNDIYLPNQYLYRPIIWYKYNGNFLINNYNNSNNFLMLGQQTGPGSSGSMVMANNQWIGIYWGVAYYGNNYFGTFTPLYSSNPTKQTIVSKYLEYIKQIDSNSKLLELFNLINMKK